MSAAANAYAIFDRASRELTYFDRAQAAAPASLLSQGVWLIDPASSAVAFSVGSFWISSVRGEFHGVEGVVTVGADSAFVIRASVCAQSIDTGIDLRDRWLRSADFLDAERHPRVELYSGAVRQSEDGLLAVDADLHLRGVTGPLALAARVLPPERQRGEVRVGIVGGGGLDRRTFALAQRRGLNAVVGVRVSLAFHVSVVKADSPERFANG